MSRSIIYADNSNRCLNRVFCDFAQTILGKNIDFGPCSSLAVLDDGNIMGVVVFHDWHPEYSTVEITGASLRPSWLSRRIVHAIACVGFDVLGVNQIAARCDFENKATSRIFPALGFKCVSIPNMRGPGRPELFFYMTRSAWSKARLSK